MNSLTGTESSRNVLRNTAAYAMRICQKFGWSRGWPEVGAYFHLEVSEYIEAIRGKRGDPVDEAADVLFVLFSSLGAEGIDPVKVFDRLVDLVFREYLEKVSSIPVTSQERKE